MKFEQQLTQRQRQTQQLALTQQLQQSLQVLQYNGEELYAFINQQALENPLIELNNQYYTGLARKNTGMVSTAMANEINFGQIADTSQSLFDYLLAQVHLNYRDTVLRKQVISLMSYLDHTGFLTMSLEEIAAESQQSYILLLDALTLIQQLDPAGVGARNLQECLMLQTERDDHAPALAYLLLESYFDLLVERKWQEIAKKLKIELAEIQAVFDYLQTLSPAPAAHFHSQESLYLVPDLKVLIDEQEIQLRALKSIDPPLKFNRDYFEQFTTEGDQAVKAFIKEKKQNFDWLKKMIEQRSSTILRVGEVIVRHQAAFFLEEQHPLKPLTLKIVADELEIHESTVSRTVNGKYIETDFGVFELKHFFSTKLTSVDGGDVSSNTAKEHLVRFIKNEDKQKPLSDQKIADLMAQIGIQLSRRTVAKYREELGILGSSKRKRFDVS